ncbi:hypothetical protein MNBD_UNCLBAC01-864 [hydrothermal vent metagenome]|uniref:Uncharacterized protein n=1 Tax=hydrothermal vent metagenome TaxID=652676 RepID=A0A3B1DJU8_9ZZZZ
MGQKLTLDDAQNALSGHLIEKAEMIRDKYGFDIDYNTLLDILSDEEVVRYPVRLEFNSEVLEQGMFAKAQPVSENPSDGYVIFVHEYFQNQLEVVPALVLYHLVSVNYGDFSTCKDAELFGASVLGMEQEDYYQLICQLADEIN